MEACKIAQLEKIIPLKWESFKPSPIHKLLYHSDCDGHINLTDVRRMIPKLEDLLDANEDSEFQKTLQTFIDGAKLAVDNKQRLEFR